MRFAIQLILFILVFGTGVFLFATAVVDRYKFLRVAQEDNARTGRH